MHIGFMLSSPVEASAGSLRIEDTKKDFQAADTYYFLNDVVRRSLAEISQATSFNIAFPKTIGLTELTLTGHVCWLRFFREDECNAVDMCMLLLDLADTDPRWFTNVEHFKPFIKNPCPLLAPFVKGANLFLNSAVCQHKVLLANTDKFMEIGKEASNQAPQDASKQDKHLAEIEFIEQYSDEAKQLGNLDKNNKYLGFGKNLTIRLDDQWLNSKQTDETRIKRLCLVHCLASAYNQQINKFNDEVADHFKRLNEIGTVIDSHNYIDETSKQLDFISQVAQFNARYFSFNPVDRDTKELYFVYQQLTERYPINQLHEEQTNQLKFLSEIVTVLSNRGIQQAREKTEQRALREKEERAEAAEAKKRQEDRNFNFIGGLLAFVGVMLAVFSPVLEQAWHDILASASIAAGVAKVLSNGVLSTSLGLFAVLLLALFIGLGLRRQINLNKD